MSEINVFDFDDVEEAKIARPVKAARPAPVKVVSFKYDEGSKFGEVKFSNGNGIEFFNGYPKKIKMTSDHELNRIRLFLAEKNSMLPNSEYYTADFYRGKTDAYYTVTFHKNNKQKIIGKGYNADDVLQNIFHVDITRATREINVFDDIVRPYIYNSHAYYLYVNYLRNKDKIDRAIERNKSMMTEKINARKKIFTALANKFIDILNNEDVITLNHYDAEDICFFIDNEDLAVKAGNMDSSELSTLAENALKRARRVVDKHVYRIHDREREMFSEPVYFYGTDKKKVAAEYMEFGLGTYCDALKDETDDDHEAAVKCQENLKRNLVLDEVEGY